MDDDDQYEYMLTFQESLDEKKRQNILDSFVKHGLNLVKLRTPKHIVVQISANTDAMLAQAKLLEMRVNLINSSNPKLQFTDGERVHLVYNIIEEALEDLNLVITDESIFEFITANVSSQKPTGIWIPGNSSGLIQRMRNYYGDEVAFYFLYMDHYMKWLLIPCVVGIIFYLFLPELNDVVLVSESQYMPFFSLFICFWSIFYIKSFERCANFYSLDWKTFDLDKKEEVRPQFTGIERISPITGLLEEYYPEWKRYPKYLVGIFVSLCMLSGTFCIMTLSLNMQGYMKNKDELLYVGYLSELASEGGYFDPNSVIMWLIPCIGHSLCVNQLNAWYSTVARRLTDWENQRTEHAFLNSLIAKRFCFEFLDAYLPLFYIAFYQRDIQNLRLELMSLYMSDEFRRVAVETLLPAIMVYFEKKSIRKDASDEALQVEYEFAKDEYENFDDYLEMVTQFGYVTLFAAAMPLAGALSLVSNIVEIQSDMYRITNLSRRPRSERTNGIGTWRVVLEFMSWFSIITNCLIFGFCSDQLESWFPSMFVPDEIGEVDDAFSDVRPEKKALLIFGVFAVEHIMIFWFLVIKFLVPSVDESTDIGIKKILYEERQSVKQDVLKDVSAGSALKSKKVKRIFTTASTLKSE